MHYSPIPPASVPLSAFPLNLLTERPRSEIEALTAALIDHLDQTDGDPDLEETGTEDGFAPHPANGPGCPLSDPDLAVDDAGCDDLNDDREHEEPIVGSYGMDQTTGPARINYAAEKLALRRHIERARVSSCRRLTRPDYMGRTHELIDDSIAINI